MKFTKIASVLLAVLLVATAGAAALPGNAPDKAQAGQADGNYENGSDAAEAANASEDDAQETSEADNESEMDNESEAKPDHAGAASERAGAAANGERGPPTDMPAQVPDFVTQIHELVNQKLDGSLDNLGEAIQGVTPDEEADDEQSADGDEADGQDDTADNDQSDADQSNSDEQQDSDQTQA
jgi:hypothetical protein